MYFLVHGQRSKHIEADCHIVRNTYLDGTIKTFHVSSRNQLADIFTNGLGVNNFLKLLKRLGIINIFAQCIQYLEYLAQNQEVRALPLRGSVENKECTQDQSKHRNTIEGRSSEQAIRAEAEWASKELMYLIEAVTYHE